MMLKVCHIAIIFFLAFASCKDSKSSNQEELTKAPEKVAMPTVTKPGSTMHYICLNNCKGSGSDKEGICPGCGKPYTHNQDFHTQADPSATSQAQEVLNNVNTVKPNIQSNQQVPPPQTNEPPQNAKGVWHFTCPKGCAGGAGTKSKCAKCGMDLVHNQVYHQ